MARRIIPQADEAAETKTPVSEEPGGAPGIPEEAPTKPVEMRPLARDPEELAKLPPVKCYRVANGGRVLYGGVPTTLRPGKVVNEATHDLGSLRAQGIVLEEVPQGS